ncbi:SDR family oxidoreductase [Burkholderia cenocepacia]|uniref:SDR family oxidoreductase n=1 Tax=Burkholderia cenocepacia TaxID=95486 RepID=UPI000A00B47E|nr:SDR family oxidoreductase [Burkholderia cenocepacia]MCW3678552.1 SDR family oxidoreductase [Burkholderia cenocepacia]MDC6086080.1 SDR family oxidoreductase [Burkholderia cenocepacia]
MTRTLQDKRVLIVGGARDIGFAIAGAVAQEGAMALIGSRDFGKACVAADGIPGAEPVWIDITEDASIIAAFELIGQVDHIVVIAAANQNVSVTELDREKSVAAFEARVIGPLLLAKHSAKHLPRNGSIVLFSGTAWNPTPGYAGMEIANGAVAFAVEHLARELAPIRVNAVSHGIIDSGSWDSLGGDRKQAFLESAARSTLVGRAGTNDDIAKAVLWLLGAGFVTGETIYVEGGARFA